MSKEIEIQVEGFAQLRQKIKKLGDDKTKRNEVEKILYQLALPTRNRAKELAPIGSRYVEINGKKYLRKDYTPGKGKESIERKKMKRARNPMVTVSPRDTKTKRGFVLRNFVIPGHNIYRVGFKRSRDGAKRRDINITRKYNARGAKARTPKNPFMDIAYNQTKNNVTASAERRMARYFQKQINRLS